MPVYGSSSYVTMLGPTETQAFYSFGFPASGSAGGQFAVPTGETQVAGTAGERCCLQDSFDSNELKSVSMELVFGGAPGTFEVDVQDADTDGATFFQNVAGGAITTVSTNNTARVELQLRAQFVRAFIKSLANSVTIIARFSR